MNPKIRVRQYKNNKCVGEYDSITEAAEVVNGQPSHISECVNLVPGHYTHKGYVWRIDYDE